MRKLIILLSLITIAFVGNCQHNNNLQAVIQGYKTSDTVMIDDFLKIGEISLNNSTYTIEEFGLILMDSGFLKEFKCNSNKITDDVRNAILDLKKGNMKKTKMLIENPRIKTPEGKIMTLGCTLYILQIK